MHVWVDVFGASDFALRLPSVIFTTGAAALTAVLGTRQVSARVGLLAGLLFVVVPTTSRYAQEARPYALAVLAAVLATLLLVRVLERPTFGRHAEYAAAIALLGFAHLIALLLLAAHAIVATMWRRRVPVGWLLAAGAGVAPVAPVIYVAYAQRYQVGWLPDVTADNAAQLPAELFGVAVIAGILIALAMIWMSLRRPALVFTVWAAVPILLLYVASQFTNLWLFRYLLFTVPAWALLGAVALSRAPVFRGAVCVLAVALIGLPVQIQFRGSAGHDQATALLASVLVQNEQPGDSIVYA